MSRAADREAHEKLVAGRTILPRIYPVSAAQPAPSKPDGDRAKDSLRDKMRAVFQVTNHAGPCDEDGIQPRRQQLAAQRQLGRSFPVVGVVIVVAIIAIAAGLKILA